ncbi:hypothetical protein D3C86_1950290 [compost metagenome]
MKIGTDSETQTAVFGCIQSCLDVFQSVVSTIRAFSFHTQFPERKCQIIRHNHQVFLRNLLLLQVVIHRFPGKVHVSCRLHQDQCPAFEFYFRYFRCFLERKSSAQLFC